jgi:glucokinase
MAPPRQQYIIGIDLGGTNIVAGAMPADGSRELAIRTAPTHAGHGADAVVDRIVGMITGVMADVAASDGATAQDFVGVGVGAPGPLDRDNGVVVVAPNLGWRNFPLRREIADRVHLPVTLDNDANCATMGEWWCGAARGARNVVGLTIGTGIGGGIVLDGQLYHGSSDVAGEIGHITIDANGRHCRCGNYGCLEAYASGPAIALRAREALERDEETEDSSTLLAMAHGDMEQLTAAMVYEAATQGDAVALEVVHDTARFLGPGVANLLNLLNPDVLVLAGGVTQAGARLFEPLRAEVRRRAFRPAVECCRIVPGMLPGTAGVVGAVATFKTQRFGTL